uniref:Putative 2-Cys peroxiredoxin BAS1 (Fragments) n=1 Tax=Pinus strobus TaxID=3348 RepID=BAS1_PINST|nr:RecName: Full=Putative 2-Cys peroxiredoxin BAS1; AltName: Full=PS13; AltName: Full=Thiol-specific antioxidant protein; AltName: Full=Thioredoxin-dependent peroxiredoxin BAS1 [Pinus strobus]
GLFIIDKEGVIQHSTINNEGVIQHSTINNLAIGRFGVLLADQGLALRSIPNGPSAL